MILVIFTERAKLFLTVYNFSDRNRFSRTKVRAKSNFVILVIDLVISMLESGGAKILVFVKFFGSTAAAIRLRFYIPLRLSGRIHPQNIILCGISCLCGIWTTKNWLASSVDAFWSREIRVRVSWNWYLHTHSEPFWLSLWGQVRPQTRFQILEKVYNRDFG